MKKIMLLLNCLLSVSLVTAVTGDTFIKTPQGLVLLKHTGIGNIVPKNKIDLKNPKSILTMNRCSAEDDRERFTQEFLDALYREASQMTFYMGSHEESRQSYEEPQAPREETRGAWDPHAGIHRNSDVVDWYQPNQIVEERTTEEPTVNNSPDKLHPTNEQVIDNPKNNPNSSLAVGKSAKRREKIAKDHKYKMHDSWFSKTFGIRWFEESHEKQIAYQKENNCDDEGRPLPGYTLNQNGTYVAIEPVIKSPKIVNAPIAPKKPVVVEKPQSARENLQNDRDGYVNPFKNQTIDNTGKDSDTPKTITSSAKNPSTIETTQSPEIKESPTKKDSKATNKADEKFKSDLAALLSSNKIIIKGQTYDIKLEKETGKDKFKLIMTPSKGTPTKGSGDLSKIFNLNSISKGDGEKFLDHIKKQKNIPGKKSTTPPTKVVVPNHKEPTTPPVKGPVQPKIPTQHTIHIPNKKIPTNNNNVSQPSSSGPKTPSSNDTTGNILSGTQAVLNVVGQYQESVRSQQASVIYPQVDYYYKIHGTYLRKEYQEFLDELLLHSKIELSEEKKQTIERDFAFRLLCDPNYKNCLKDINPALNSSDTTQNTDPINGISDLFASIQNRIIKHNEAKIKKNSEIAQGKAEHDYKTYGNYISEYHKQILDTALAINKIQLTPDQRQRMEKQLAINFLVDPNYQKAFETFDFTVTKNNTNPNKDSIRNVDDIFTSIYSRLPEDSKLFYKKSLEKADGNGASFRELYNNPNHIIILTMPKDYTAKAPIKFEHDKKCDEGLKERAHKFEKVSKQEEFEKETRHNIKKNAELLVGKKQTTVGSYTNKEYSDKLDRLLDNNQIKLTPNQRLKLEKQLALNCYINNYYKDAFEKCNVDINADNKTSNSAVIKDINDVFESQHNRHKNNQNNNSKTPTTIDQKLEDAWILRCPENDVLEYAVCNAVEEKKHNDPKTLTPEDLNKIEKPLSPSKLEMLAQQYPPQEPKTQAQEKASNRVAVLLSHINPEAKKYISDSTRKTNESGAMRKIFSEQAQNIYLEISQYKELSKICKGYGLNDGNYLDKRIAVIDDLQQNGAIYKMQSYTMQEGAKELLRKNGHDDTAYKKCYGNQLQHLIHQDCITLVERVSAAKSSNAAYVHKDALVDCIDAARKYNQAGFSEKALHVTDFCRSLLDYGKAVLEGAVQGIVGATTDCINHPIQTALYVAAGEYMFAYQLCKVTFNIADIGFTSLINSERGAQKWNDFIEPLTTIIDTIYSKEASLRDVIKDTTQLAVQWQAQAQLLSGLGKFYKTTKDKAIDFLKKNPKALPEQYLVTPEGCVLKVAGEPELHNKVEGIKKQVSDKIDGKNNGRNINKNQKKEQNLKNRKVNTIAKTKFFDGISDKYEGWKKDIYRVKKGQDRIEGAEYLHWDFLHGEIEAYSKSKDHLGAIDPHTNRLYKPAVKGRVFPGK